MQLHTLSTEFKLCREIYMLIVIKRSMTELICQTKSGRYAYENEQTRKELLMKNQSAQQTSIHHHLSHKVKESLAVHIPMHAYSKHTIVHSLNVSSQPLTPAATTAKLARSLKPYSPARMIIHITLDNPQTIHHAGEKITGIVLLLVRKPTLVHHVQVVFLGESRTVINATYQNGAGGTATHQYSRTAPLFAVRKTLCVGPLTLEPGKYQWRFDFAFPARADALQDVDWGRPWGDFIDHPMFPSQAPQPLPPSCRVAAGNGTGTVFYGLRAEIVGQAGFTSRKSQVRNKFICPVTFSPLRIAHKPGCRVARQVRGLVRRSYKVDTERNNSLTFRESMHWMFKRSKLPVVDLIVAVDIPLTMVLGARPPIFLCLKVDPQGSSFTKYPPVLLRKVHVVLNIRTTVRTPAEWPEKHSRVANGFGKHKLLKIRYKDPIPLEGRLDLRELFPDMQFPPYQPPTFKTYNIKRIYGLSIELSISCANKKYRLSFKPEETEVLPAKSVHEYFGTSDNFISDENASTRFLQLRPPEIDTFGISSCETSISGWVSSAYLEEPPPAYTPRSVVA